MRVIFISLLLLSMVTQADERQSYVVLFSGNDISTVITGKPYRQLSGINGVVVDLTVAEHVQLENDALVKSIEPNRVVELDDIDAGEYLVASKQLMSAKTSTGVQGWGLDRLDQQSLPLDNNYQSVAHGNGAHAYILSTGIRLSHQDFAGRAVADFIASGVNEGPEDNNGHGTLIAGIVGGISYGVAREVAMHSVKVFDSAGFATIADLIEGIDYITNNHQSPAVAVFGASLPASSALQLALEQSINAGVVYALPSGDIKRDACDYSPATQTNAITVAASKADDRVSPATNFGPCVDVYAPGYHVKSAWHLGDHYNNTGSHSPVAAAHVAGVAALVRGIDNSCSVNEVKAYITENARSGQLSDVPTNTQNRLIAGISANENLPNCTPPVATWTHTHNMGRCRKILGSGEVDNDARFNGEYKVINDTNASVTFGCFVDLRSDKAIYAIDVDFESTTPQWAPVCRLQIEYSPGGSDYVDLVAIDSQGDGDFDRVSVTDPDVQYKGNGYAQSGLLRCSTHYYADETIFKSLRLTYLE